MHSGEHSNAVNGIAQRFVMVALVYSIVFHVERTEKDTCPHLFILSCFPLFP